MLYLDGLSPVGPFLKSDAYLTIAIVLVFWGLTMIFMARLVRIAGVEFRKKAESSGDVPVVVIFNLLLFGLFLSTQITTAMSVILWERRIYSVSQIAPELGSWIVWYLFAGILFTFGAFAFARRRTIVGYVGACSVPMLFMTSTIILLGIKLWPDLIDIELFSTMLTLAAMASVVPWMVIGGIAGLVIILSPLKWAYS